MKLTLTIILPLFITSSIFAQSVKTKAHAIMKDFNLPAEVYEVDLPNNKKGLIIGMKAIDTTVDLTEYYRDVSEPIAFKLRYQAIADSSKYFEFLSICYNSLIKKAIIFNFRMNDKIFDKKD